jgi:hypothetical protein
MDGAYEPTPRAGELVYGRAVSRSYRIVTPEETRARIVLVAGTRRSQPGRRCAAGAPALARGALLGAFLLAARTRTPRSHRPSPLLRACDRARGLVRPERQLRRPGLPGLLAGEAARVLARQRTAPGPAAPRRARLPHAAATPGRAPRRADASCQARRREPVRLPERAIDGNPARLGLDLAARGRRPTTPGWSTTGRTTWSRTCRRHPRRVRSGSRRCAGCTK